MKYVTLIEQSELELKRQHGRLQVSFDEMNNKEREYNIAKENYNTLNDMIINLTAELDEIKAL